MKSNRKIIFVFAALLATYLVSVEKEAQAANLKIYVSVTGKDENPGTKELPMASLKGAVSKLWTMKNAQAVNGPVEIIISDGTYFITDPLVLNPVDSGTENAPVIFKAEEGTHPVFCGGKKIGGFEKISETLWRTKVPEVAEYGWYFEQLYVNGKRAVRAKSPNTGFYHLKNVSETILQKGKERTPELAVQRFTLFPDGAGQIA